MIELYKRLRPGDPPTLENASSLLNSLLFNPRRYDLARWAATSSTSAWAPTCLTLARPSAC